MRFVTRASQFLIVAATAAVFAATLQAQTQTPQEAQQPQPQSTQPITPGNGTYISSDPLASVKYDNRWDVSVAMAYGHIHAGPNLREGANLGGLDGSASYWFSKRFAVEGSARGYVGTSGAPPNPYFISGPFVAQYMFLAGPEYLGPHNKHGAIILHALVGAAHGDFQHDLRGTSPELIGFYKDQTALGGAFGAHLDLNRSPRWVFRITPEALLTGYDGYSGNPHTQWNFGLSVGVQYKFKKKR